MAIKISDKIQNEAVEWHARLGNEDATDSDWLDFTQWLEENDAHRIAYDAIEDMLNEIELLDSPQKATIHKITDTSKTVNNIRWQTATKWLGAIAAAAAIFVVVNILFLQGNDYKTLEYSAGSNEPRLISLEDGTTVRLNINSKIKIMFDDKVRRTELEYGQGIYRVAKNAERPFIVQLGDSKVVVTGTIFDIVRENKKIKVSVAEGSVNVSSMDPKINQETLSLLPGSVLEHKENMTDIVLSQSDPEAILSWEDGYLEYEDAKLEDIATDLNRYFKEKIKVFGSARELRFSGIIRTSDEKAALLVLSEGLPVNMENKNGEIRFSPASK